MREFKTWAGMLSLVLSVWRPARGHTDILQYNSLAADGFQKLVGLQWQRQALTLI